MLTMALFYQTGLRLNLEIIQLALENYDYIAEILHPTVVLTQNVNQIATVCIPVFSFLLL